VGEGLHGLHRLCGRPWWSVAAEQRDTTFAVVTRAPLAKLQAYKALKEWHISWFSSFGSDFNYDFHVTLDPKVAPAEYNYRTKAEMSAAMGHSVLMEGEEHGLSVFFQLDGEVFRTYSVYARGVESLTDSYRLLDTTPYGRQQDFEDSPAGWPQQPTYGKVETKGWLAADKIGSPWALIAAAKVRAVQAVR
jgi:predicted dithiol-disulfide oxidoreductase (DUF899 family)